MRLVKQRIFGKNYKLLVAKTLQQKKKGLNIFCKCPPNTGMLFLYPDEIVGRSFTLSQTPFNLHVIFLDNNNNIVYRETGTKYQKKPIICNYLSSKVIEIPA